jgi:hypothetical protein
MPDGTNPNPNNDTEKIITEIKDGFSKLTASLQPKTDEKKPDETSILETIKSGFAEIKKSLETKKADDPDKEPDEQPVKVPQIPEPEPEDEPLPEEIKESTVIKALRKILIG